MTLFGPDISKYQEGLVPPEPHGINFGICRATKGVTIDPVVDNAIAWCQTNKVPFCAYHFLVPLSIQNAAMQAAAFHMAVGKNKTIPCMLDWERSSEGWEPTLDEALVVIEAIRKIGHDVNLLYTGKWYWDLKGQPVLSGYGFDLVNADYGPNNPGDPAVIYSQRGGDTGRGWNAYGGLTPAFWQFGSNVTWGNKNLDFNAYRGDPSKLSTWFYIGGTVVTYPYAWGSTRLTMEQLEEKLTVKNAHPEFWRRVKPMLEAGEGKLGTGCIWRSSDVQLNTFLTRHYTVPSGGCCYYQSQRYQLKKGMAHAAPPGKSFHESTFHGYAAAGDMVGDLAWMHSVQKDYGLKDFRNVGNEPWHIQFAELPNSVTQWKAAGSPNPEIWKLPNEPEPEEPDVTDEDIEKVAKRTKDLIFQEMMPDIVSGKDQSFENMIRYTRSDANKTYKRLAED